MNRELDTAFENCLMAMDQGESLDQALSRYPEKADELRPLLTLASRTRQFTADLPSRATAMRSRSQMLGRAFELRTVDRGPAVQPWLRWSIALLGLSLFILISGGVGLMAASAQSLPGDGLYPLKRSAERIQLSFTPGLTNRLSLTITQDMRRLDEVLRLLELKRVEAVEFEANLSDRQGSRWQFGDIPVLVTQNTSIPSGLRVGDLLRIRGRTTSQGWVRADSIAAVGLTFDGYIEAMKGNIWVIDGRSLVILASSEIDGNLATGDLVRVHARSEGESLVIQRVIGINPAATPIPTLAPASPAADEPDPTTSSEADQDDRDESGDDESEDEREERATAEPDEDEGEEHEEGSSSGEGEPTPEAEETEDGSHEADDEHEGELKEIEFNGVIQAIDGNRWLIDGTTFLVDEETRLEGDPEIGDEVEVKAEQRQDGTLYAVRIDRHD